MVMWLSISRPARSFSQNMHSMAPRASLKASQACLIPECLLHPIAAIHRTRAPSKKLASTTIDTALAIDTHLVTVVLPAKLHVDDVLARRRPAEQHQQRSH